MRLILDMSVEFKCQICEGELDDDKSMANFMLCKESFHGILRFFTGDGCFFTRIRRWLRNWSRRESEFMS